LQHGKAVLHVTTEAVVCACRLNSKPKLIAYARTHVHAHLDLKVSNSCLLMMKSTRACLLVNTSVYAKLAEYFCFSATCRVVLLMK